MYIVGRSAYNLLMNPIIQTLLDKKVTVSHKLEIQLDDAQDRLRRAKNKEQEVKDALRKRLGEVAELQALGDAERRGEISTEEAEAQARKIYYNR